MSTTDDRTPIVATDGVDVVRGGRYLLSDISIRVHPGEHWALLGPNGAGKSTLLHILGAFGHPTHGTVDVLGARLGRVDMRALRTHIGHVDPRHRLDLPTTAHDVVLTGLTNTPELDRRRTYTDAEHRRADELLDILGMASRRLLPWTTMSQGERGRTLVARALIGSPSLVLLDEPATGLDLAAREQLLIGIDELRSQVPDLASIMVTHHLEDLPTSTSHALLLAEGRSIAQGPVDAALTSATVSACFDHPVQLDRVRGRWSATTRRTDVRN